jgi:hypothetical protein
MKRLPTKTAAAAVTLAVLAAAHLGIAPRAAEAGDKHAWGIGTLGETCGGNCGASNICCKIVILPAE